MASKSEDKVVRFKFRPKREDIKPIIKDMWPIVKFNEATEDEKLHSVISEKPWVLFIVQNKNNADCGYLLLTRPDIDFVHCPLLHVREKRKGYGTALFRTAKEYAKCHIRLGTELSNKAAIKFYKSLGPSSAKKEGSDMKFEWTYDPPRRQINPDLEATIAEIEEEAGIPEVKWAIQKWGSTTGKVIDEKGEPVCETMFCIGSISKLFTNATLVIILNKFGLRLQDRILDRLEGVLHDRTFSELLSHFRGLPQINDLLLGPEGTLLISTEEEFLEIAKRLPQLDSWEYSNANSIAIGILIRKISGFSVGKAIKEYLIDRLGLSRTCSTSEDFERLRKYVAQPHIVDTNRKAIPLELRECFGIDLPAMGIYSSVKDLLKFFKALIEKEIEEVDPERFLASCVTFEPSKDTYSYFGLCTPLSRIGRGIESNNNIWAPSAGYLLGHCLKTLKKDPVVYHKQGTVTGYTCAVSLQATSKKAVVVLSNASGQVDAVDYIFRAITQNLCGFYGKDFQEVNNLAMLKIGQKQQEQWFKFNFPMPSKETASKLVQKCPDLIGSFRNKEFKQLLNIVKLVDHYEASFAGSSGQSHSEPLWLFPDEEKDNFVLIRPGPDIDIAMLGIDIRDSWFPLSIQVCCINGKIELRRESRYRSLVYNRVNSISSSASY